MQQKLHLSQSGTRLVFAHLSRYECKQNTYSNPNIHRRMCDDLRQVWHADWPTNGGVVALRSFCSLSVNLLKRKFAVANGRWSFWAISPFGSDNKFFFCWVRAHDSVPSSRHSDRWVSYFTPFLLLIGASVEGNEKHPNHFLFILWHFCDKLLDFFVFVYVSAIRYMRMGTSFATERKYEEYDQRRKKIPTKTKKKWAVSL